MHIRSLAMPMACCLLLPAAAATATTLMPWELTDFVANSRAVVTATVTAVDVRYNADRTMVHTFVTLAVEDQLAGRPVPAEIVLTEMGGRVGYRATVVHGVPIYRPGERVLVFLEELEDGSVRTLGFYQGKYTLEVEADTGRELFVQRAPSGVVLGLEPQDPEPLVRYGRDELVSRVRAIAGGE